MREKILQHGNADLKQMIIHWLPTDFCNYNCSYCIAHAPHLKNGIEFIKLPLLITAVDKIFEINKDKYVFVFGGGEATLHPNFIQLVEYILKNENMHGYICFLMGIKMRISLKSYFLKITFI